MPLEPDDLLDKKDPFEVPSVVVVPAEGCDDCDVRQLSQLEPGSFCLGSIDCLVRGGGLPPHRLSTDSPPPSGPRQVGLTTDQAVRGLAWSGHSPADWVTRWAMRPGRRRTTGRRADGARGRCKVAIIQKNERGRMNIVKAATYLVLCMFER